MKDHWRDCTIDELKNLGGVVRFSDGTTRRFSMFDLLANTSYGVLRIGDRARWRDPKPGLSCPHPERENR